MKRMQRLGRSTLFLLAAFLGGMVGSWVMHPEAPAAGPVDLDGKKSGIIGTFAVGGVLSADGKLWQYRPDKKRWIALDESYALEGEGTQIVPLPIPVQDIRHMETFGFLVDRDNVCWLYDFEGKRWQRIGSPPLK